MNNSDTTRAPFSLDIRNLVAASAFMRARLEIMLEDDPKARLAHQWVPYSRISMSLKRAVIASEDATFVSHRGFDWKAIQEAHKRNLEEGEVVRGASTITQQLAKNLFLTQERTLTRKIQELGLDE